MWDWTDWTITFSILTIVAAMLGFTEMPVDVLGLARSLFYIFLILAVGSSLNIKRMARNLE